MRTMVIEKHCVYCDKKFIAKQKRKRFCSDVCRASHSRLMRESKKPDQLEAGGPVDLTRGEVKTIEKVITEQPKWDVNEQLQLIEDGKLSTQKRLERRWKQLEELRQKYSWVQFFDEWRRLNKIFGSA